MNNCSTAIKAKRSFIRRTAQWFIRCLVVLVALFSVYAASVWILGRVPVNRDFRHAGFDGVEILLINNGVHADLVVPMSHHSFPLRSYFSKARFQVPLEEFEFAIVGWGSRKFYLETETWDDLKLSTVGIALSGMDRTTVHVRLVADMDWDRGSSRKIRISQDQFTKLGVHIVSSLVLDEDSCAIPIKGAHYRTDDAFFEGQGSYHLFRTCNVWVGQGLKKSGVRVGVWTVTPDSLFASLPSDAR